MARRTLPIPILIAALAAGASFADPEDGRIHDCPDANGEIVYQLGPCDAPQPNRKPPPKVEAKPVTAKPSKKSKADPATATAATRSSAPKPQQAVPASVSKRQKNSQAIKPVIDPRTFTADPNWGSPERTLKTYIAAMKAGDRKLARACLVAAALDDLGSRIETLPDNALRSAVEGYTGFVMEGDLGPYWSIRALRAGSRPAWIFFERTSDGTWKIAAI
jgi:hypothetical protein